MTPYDIYRKWQEDIFYIAPNELGLHLARTSRAITAVEEIFDKQSRNSEAGEEALEVLEELRVYFRAIVIRSKASE